MSPDDPQSQTPPPDALPDSTPADADPADERSTRWERLAQVHAEIEARDDVAERNHPDADLEQDELAQVGWQRINPKILYALAAIEFPLVMATDYYVLRMLLGEAGGLLALGLSPILAVAIALFLVLWGRELQADQDRAAGKADDEVDR